MNQVIMRRGKVEVVDIPAPLIEEGHILVEVAYSLISTGTEVSSVVSSGNSLARKAIEQPERVKKLVAHFQQQGLRKTVDKVFVKLDEVTTLGYSCVGRVINSGTGADQFQEGDWVACAGAGSANHAEIVLVPKNLVVKVPEGCNLKPAATVTLGAIAMQGTRRADPRLGEYVAVIGLGLLGLITVQLLKASGCQVIGFDLDPNRVNLSKKLGADFAYVSNECDPIAESHRISDNFGVDITIITASSNSNVIVQQAMEMTRKKGRVVVVGSVGLGLKRSPFYEKEIDLLISTSYGPGRYDEKYEKEGLDYPYSYVRWTENRNMQEYLRLVNQKMVNVDPILQHEVDVHNVAQAFDELMKSDQKPLSVVIRYPMSGEHGLHNKLRTIVNLRADKKKDSKIGVALIGAGSFAQGMHLPNLVKLANSYQLEAIVDANGVNAKSSAERFDARNASSSFEDILNNERVDLLMICTRHNTHARMVLQGLNAGKHVFVEKPLSLNEVELNEIENFYSDTGDQSAPLLMTGFNRRFSPFTQRILKFIQNRKDPMIINYQMNAGYIPLDHWVHSDEGGGRNLGEACHIYDLFTYLMNSKVTRVSADSIRPLAEFYSASDNFVANIRFDDGSIASLTYTSLGTSDYPKEKMELFLEGKILRMEDYRMLKIFGSKMNGLHKTKEDKGHLEELRMLAKAIQEGGDWPIPLWEQVQATRIALMIESRIKN